MKSKETVRRRTANCVRHDFAQGAIISVDGWLLSLTEARVFDKNDGTARLKDHAIVLAKNILTNRRLKGRHWLFIGGVP